MEEKKSESVPLTVVDTRMTIVDARTTSCNIRTYAVIQQSEDYYIIKDEEGEVRAISKDNCKVESISAWALLR